MNNVSKVTDKGIVFGWVADVIIKRGKIESLFVNPYFKF